jgi:small subunit ribosomal protein S10
MVGNRIRIRLKSFDHELIESSIRNILEALGRVGAKTSGPVPLPTKIKKYTVLRSPHVDKKSREQLEIRIHKRLIDILEPDEKTIDVLKQLKLPTGVEVEIK